MIGFPSKSKRPFGIGLGIALGLVAGALAFTLALALETSDAFASPAANKPEIVKRTLTAAGQTRAFWLFVPAAPSATPATSAPRPLIVLLHGSGRNGETLIKPWKDLAEKEGIVLAAPDSSDSVHWASPADGPGFLKDVVDAVSAGTPIDPRRVYLFGHSAGAVFALQMAAFESEYFAACAIHAGSLHADYLTTFDWAKRKIPFAIWIGTRDAFFSLDDVRATRDALRTRGFPLVYTEIPGHTHDYYASAKEINPAVWSFFQEHPLAGDPKFTLYGDTK
jgi:poly(3-hydroxybutyrate) depolymerase